MQNGSESESGERRAGRRSALTLVAIVAVAGTIGIVVSFGQRSPAAPPVPTATAPARITPSPVPAEPEVGTSFAVADDLATREVVLFGGEDDGDNTWLWNRTRWTLARPPNRPPGRFGASAAYDPATQTVLLFGGRTEDGTAVADTWSWDGTDWNELDGGTDGPAPGEGSDIAWDAAQRQMVLVIGSGGAGTGATWIWAGTHWRRVAGGSLPAAWFYSPMWSDPVTGSLTAVGCCTSPPPASGAVESTWQWNGSAWRQLATSHDAPLDGSTMALDPSLGRLVLCSCGYVEPQKPEPELSVWSGRNWAVMPIAHLPVQGGTVITDLDRGQLLLLGSPVLETASSPAPVQVWSLAGSSWHRLD